MDQAEESMHVLKSILYTTFLYVPVTYETSQPRFYLNLWFLKNILRPYSLIISLIWLFKSTDPILNPLKSQFLPPEIVRADTYTKTKQTSNNSVN